LKQRKQRARSAIKRKYPIAQGVLIWLVKVIKRDHGVYVELTPQPA
jgi:hypothetical protein